MSPLNIIAIVPVPEKPLCHQKKDLKARWAPEVKQRFSGSLGEEILKKARACFDANITFFLVNPFRKITSVKTFLARTVAVM